MRAPRIWLVPLAVVALGGTALALTRELREDTIHAGLCKTDSPNVLTLEGGMANVSTSSSMVLACPLPISARNPESTLAGDGGQICGDFNASLRPWVSVFDRNRTEDVVCTLFLLGPGGATMKTFTARSQGFSSAPQKIFFDMTFSEIATGVTFFAYCTVPPKDIDLSMVSAFSLNVCESI
jgi:hypothetical protein